MMSPKVESWTDAVAERLRVRLNEEDLPLLPKGVRIHEETDTLGEDAWRLVLVLPAPEGPTWDRLDVFQVRRKAVDLFDEIADEDRENLPGSTIAIVTTDEASEEDTAAEDGPTEADDPGRAQ